ncbi:unnamed protein product [Pseudo-nitzschia multistriata]|uniref:Uncharacterized protein n=1 Tax=Pseudo-nitzschia multistriata TaxID=183589 RepID=A0A448ZCX1_9STRA|nr:unnamed protein product [Pseudo-nitzschia multistriata]
MTDEDGASELSLRTWRGGEGRSTSSSTLFSARADEAKDAASLWSDATLLPWLSFERRKSSMLQYSSSMDIIEFLSSFSSVTAEEALNRVVAANSELSTATVVCSASPFPLSSPISRVRLPKVDSSSSSSNCTTLSISSLNVLYASTSSAMVDGVTGRCDNRRWWLEGDPWSVLRMVGERLDPCASNEPSSIVLPWLFL